MVRFTLVALVACWIHDSAGVLAADHAPGQFQHHADVQVTLFAQEPDIVDPVSLTFASNGDCYVVEMRDYPYGVGSDKKPGGTIRLLKDYGKFDFAQTRKSILFASGLSFPTSIMAWRDGVLVLAPPAIRFLKDSDGDGKADVNEVIISGLRRGVTDSNANSLRWGIDNMIHVANGGNGGKVKFAGSNQSAISLGNSDFAFDIDSKTIVKTARTGGGFGLVFDDFGHSFTTHNLDYLQQRIVPIRNIEQSPEVFSFKATENISDHGVSARIFPIVEAVTRVNHPEQAGRFSSAGGMGILDSKLFSPKLANSIFVCDVVCNLVHRDVLREDGPAFRAGRAPEEQQREFIASTDPAFRPVGLESGPNGWLYLIDMQRDVIEHPDYIPAGVRKNLDIRAGHDRGRIYQVSPFSKIPRITATPSFDSTEQLVTHLASDARWNRETAHRLFIERMPADAIDSLTRQGMTSKNPATRARALWILNKLDPQTMQPALAALQDQHAGVRENAIRVLASRLDPGQRVPEELLAMLSDPHPRVRFQTTLAIDTLNHESKAKQLSGVLQQDYDNKWSRRAVMLAIDQQARPLLMKVFTETWFNALSCDEAKRSLTHELANVAAATTDSNVDFADWLQALDLEAYDSRLVASLLAGLRDGWQRNRDARLTTNRIESIIQAWASASIAGIESELIDLVSLFQIDFPESLRGVFAEARELAVDRDVDSEKRIAAIDLLARDTSSETFVVLVDLLSANETTAIQQAAVAAAGNVRRDETGQELLAAWPGLMPGVRNEVIRILLSRRQYQLDLLTALEQGSVRFSELNLDLEQRRRLLRWSSREVGQRAAKLFGDEEYSNRKEIVEEWLAKLPDKGVVNEGRKVYAQKCATCHVSDGNGNRVGPDLDSLSHRSVEDLLTHILDPNMSINPNYVSCVVQTIDGQIVNGLLAEETSQSITLKQAEGKTTTISRDEIEQLKTLNTSLMPEGIEKELTPQQMRSLIAYLQEN